ncbi:MAG: biopolymer transporter ExbD [Magnetospirillum sp.]|nr:biopolymer transporter ExbD [Magnetospirillum sp.]
MAVSFPLGDGDDDEAVLVAINTTPLVDVMLVLLIIFLITVPAVSATIPVSLPRQDAPVSDVSAVTLTVDAEGRLYWNDMPMANTDELRARLAPWRPPAPPFTCVPTR